MTDQEDCSTTSDARKPAPVMALLRAENGALFVAALVAFTALNGGWLLFAVLILVPDLAIVAYRVDARWGARAYNAAHSYLAPIALGLLGWLLDRPILIDVALIWIVHIAFDRVLGFGLKHPGSFRDTHLGSLRGSASSAAGPNGTEP